MDKRPQLHEAKSMDIMEGRSIDIKALDESRNRCP
jgi:hypothetical protein